MLTRRNAIGLLAALPMVNAAPTAAQEPRRGGTLVMAGGATTRSFNNAVAAGVPTMIPGAQLFASPLQHDEDWQPHPYLAEAWEIAGDGRSVTLHLRRDAVFHDGHPITAEDVAFSIITIRDNHPFDHLRSVTSVDTPAPHTAVIRLAQPFPAILYAMGPALMPILPKHIYDDGQPIKTHPRNARDVVGSGPFKLVEFVPGERFVLQRHDGFFLPGKPFLDRIVFKATPDSQTALLEFEAGRLDLYAFFNRVLEIERAQANPRLGVTPQGYKAMGALNWLDINNRKKPFDDVRVRQAIAHAIDKDFIVKALHKGLSKAATGPIHSSFPQYSRDVSLYPHDLAKANALLDAAGLPKAANGMRLALTCDYYPGDEDGQKRIAEYLKPALKRVGIDVETRAPADFASWMKRIGMKDYDISMSSGFAWGDPAIGVHRTYLSNNIVPAALTNDAQYVNPKVDSLLYAAERETDPARRNALYAEFQKIVTADVPVVWITELPYHTIYNKRVRNVPTTIWGVGSPLMDIWLAE